jgi:hypothetical protein
MQLKSKSNTFKLKKIVFFVLRNNPNKGGLPIDNLYSN